MLPLSQFLKAINLMSQFLRALNRCHATVPDGHQPAVAVVISQGRQPVAAATVPEGRQSIATAAAPATPQDESPFCQSQFRERPASFFGEDKDYDKEELYI